MKYAPIVIFAFNRLELLKACVAALQRNDEAAESDLIVYVDGPREDKIGEAGVVENVKNYVRNITGFKSLTYHFSEKNKKLGPSIIAGVTNVMSKYGKSIIVEDDLIVSRNFLSFVNQGLELYKDNKEVFSICGYTNKVKRPESYSFDAYFCTRSSSWGWATWADRWNSVDWDLNDWASVEINRKSFNQWGGSDCFKMLKDWKFGRNQSWAIRFCYAEFVQDKLSVFPMKSLVDNEGFDGQGSNCKKWSRYKFEIDISGNKQFVFPKVVCRNKDLFRDALRYHKIWLRVYSRIMYIWYDIKI